MKFYFNRNSIFIVIILSKIAWKYLSVRLYNFLKFDVIVGTKFCYLLCLNFLPILKELLMKYLFSLILFLTINNVYSQSEDSTKTYELDEITVKSGIILEPKTITEINYKEIEKADASSVIDLGKFIPSVKVQTNSRGESLFFLRGSGERQIALLFDGVPMNIPWDNRIDLSLIPTDAIGEITVTKGIPSTVYGANTLAGVISINSKEYNEFQKNKKFVAQHGENGFKKYSGYWIDGSENFSYLVSMSYKNSNGYRLPDAYDNPIANPSSFRINSFSESYNAFGKVNFDIGDFSETSVSFSYINSEKGVPPETDVSNPRFWIYPEWQKSTLTINGSTRFENDKSSMLVYSFSGSKFNMQIDQYKDISFTTIDDIEKDDDLILNGRLIYSKMFGNSLLKFSFNGFTTEHKEKFLQEDFVEKKFVQNVYSIGAEYELIEENYTAIVGASIDNSSTPETGDKPSKDAITDYSFNTAFVYSLNPRMYTQINFGRKTRFPTLRETFSGALGRFVPNPDLKSEVATTLETSLTYKDNISQVNLNLFFTYLQDGIVRISLPERQFQRVNKDAIRTVGVEFNAFHNFSKDLFANFNFTYLNALAENENGEFTDTLEYKPKFVAGFNINYAFYKNFNAVIESNFVGEEFGFQEGNEFIQKLPNYLLFNFRLSYLFNIYKDVDLQLYFRLNNVFDKLYYTQWSLPEPGRQFWFGTNIEF